MLFFLCVIEKKLNNILVVIPRLRSSGFCCMFWYHSDLVTNGTKNGSWP